MKTKDLIGPALDWAVEVANGTHWSANGYFIFRYPGCGPNGHIDKSPQWSYSTDWSQGGPIIEREGIAILKYHPDCPDVQLGKEWLAQPLNGDYFTFLHEGPTPLIAAMRCYVSSKLGEDVIIPKELTK